MPCATLHVMVHLLSKDLQLSTFPAIHTIRYSSPDAPEHYTLSDMILWATLPYGEIFDAHEVPLSLILTPFGQPSGNSPTTS